MDTEKKFFKLNYITVVRAKPFKKNAWQLRLRHLVLRNIKWKFGVEASVLFSFVRDIHAVHAVHSCIQLK